MVNTKLDALAGMLDVRFNSVDQQLCTPQGLRECFPVGHAASPEEPAQTQAPVSTPASIPGRRQR